MEATIGGVAGLSSRSRYLIKYVTSTGAMIVANVPPINFTTRLMGFAKTTVSGMRVSDFTPGLFFVREPQAIVDRRAWPKCLWPAREMLPLRQSPASPEPLVPPEPEPIEYGLNSTVRVLR